MFLQKKTILITSRGYVLMFGSGGSTNHAFSDDKSEVYTYT